jgi:serine/threonine protein kinase
VGCAVDEVLGRRVAAKQIRMPVSAGDARQGRGRVLREARAAARLNHPAGTTVFDVVTDEDVLWLVMEYVSDSGEEASPPAPSLRDIVKDQDLSRFIL